MTMTREQVAYEQAKPENADRHAVIVHEDGDEYVAEWEGQEVRAGNPFGLDSELSRIGAPSPRNLYPIEDVTP